MDSRTEDDAYTISSSCESIANGSGEIQAIEFDGWISSQCSWNTGTWTNK